MKLNDGQREYVLDWLTQANAFLHHNPGHKLAIADVDAFEAALDGEYTEHFIDFLKDSVTQMKANPIWQVNSNDQIEVMETILEQLEIKKGTR